eukprot:TRINITY_DN340_c0_g1_i3.p1 TRINITY_DN340_c0_g1~~TRINITY_DN340_c0_g1_i3.p1  ORF type:complete len:214 (+),score=60.04 TRINITY_DN340_c0_g1_i3:84-644(+)
MKSALITLLIALVAAVAVVNAVPIRSTASVRVGSAPATHSDAVLVDEQGRQWFKLVNAQGIWTDCGSNSTDDFIIESVSISPNPPKKGETITVSASGSLKTEVTSGSVVVDVKYGFLPVVDKTLDICQLDPSKLPCPFKPANLTIGPLSVEIPSKVPDGHYKGNAKATDQSGNEIFCVDIDFDLQG